LSEKDILFLTESQDICVLESGATFGATPGAKTGKMEIGVFGISRRGTTPAKLPQNFRTGCEANALPLS